MTEPSYTATILPRIADISAADWDILIPQGSHPFLSHRFLHAMEESGSATSGTGWTPRHIWVEDTNGNAVGAAPLYVKSHSRGEYVFIIPSCNALYPSLQPQARAFWPLRAKASMLSQAQ